MNSYEIFQIVGVVLLFVITFFLFAGLARFYKKIQTFLFSNPTKELLKTYLFWSDFISDITNKDQFKIKLQSIKTAKVYKNQFNKFYLTYEEATSQGDLVEEISIKEVLSSSTYPLYLMIRLKNITLYSYEDLKNIHKTSQMIWTFVDDTLFHMIIDGGKIVYPLNLMQNSEHKFGYEIFYNQYNKIGVYDVSNEKLALEFEYNIFSSFGNIVEVSKDNKMYEIYDLKTNELLFTNNIKTFPNIDEELKERIDFSKIELQDYMKLNVTPQNEEDLAFMGLWNAKVAVLKIPTDFDEIIDENSSGVIRYSYPITADIFNMNKELPIEFKKKDGEYICLGIEFKYLILYKEYREILSQIKHDFSNNSLNTILSFTNEQFNRFVIECDHILLFTFLSTLSTTELQKFYEYNDRVVKLAEGTKKSAREQFEEGLDTLKQTKISETQKQRASQEIPKILQKVESIKLS